MKKYVPILAGTQLFRGVEACQVEAMLHCLDARLCTYQKGEYILRQGDTLDDIVIMVEGSAHIQKDDYWGSRSILGHLEAGDMFGEAYAAPESGPLLNDVVAIGNCAAIFFDVRRVITTCSSACVFHALVVQNMFFAICEKNKALVQKLGHMSQRSTKEKLLSYLSEEAKRQGSAAFEIPFNRQQLADFLSVDRSAMSNELCKLRDAGIIRFARNRFELL